MRTKFLLAVLLFTLAIAFETFGQNGFVFQGLTTQISCKETFFDADSLPYKIQWTTNGKFDSSKYVDEQGRQIRAKFLLMDSPKYEGGLEEFKKFFRSNFIKPKQVETNSTARVLLIFSSGNLHVRILQRIGYGQNYFDYDAEIKRIFLLTNEKWKVENSIGFPISVFEYFVSIP
jgi:hypothetical protein